VPLDIVGTAFQWKVWKALTEIPPGQTRSYGEIAKSIGETTAARAVGRACATNQAAGVIPCHRAVGARGSLNGYRWGVARKETAAGRRAAGRGAPAQAARRRRRRRRDGGAQGRTPRTRPRLSERFSQPTNSARIRPPRTPPALQARSLAGDDEDDSGNPAPSLHRENCRQRARPRREWSCRAASSEACGTSLPRPRARVVSRSKL